VVLTIKGRSRSLTLALRAVLSCLAKPTIHENALPVSEQKPSATSIDNYLLGLHKRQESIVLLSVETRRVDLGPLMRFDLDIGFWTDEIIGRPEAKQLQDARRELGFATYAACSGLYRLAYGGLRLFLELSVAAVYFSANELHRRRWISDRADFSWAKALDEADGVLSPGFVREFLPDSVSEAPPYAAIAAQCYRHCSQFVHGKLAVTSTLPNELTFADGVLTDWIDTARKAAEAVLYMLYCRYAADILDEAQGKLHPTLERFTHLRSVRRALGLPMESEGASG
jgi:hypothetical protein